MKRWFKLWLLLFSTSASAFWLWPAAAQTPRVDFVRDIQPILQAHCAGCHGAQKALAQLRLDSKQSAAHVLKPGDSQASRLWQRITETDSDQRMPLGKPPLAKAQIELIKRWIEEGAPWPETESAIRNPQSAIERHWGFVAPVRPALPAVKNKAWVRNPIDAFVLAKLEQEGLTPAPEADRVTLLRRLSLDLIGLPPTPQEVDAFLKDKTPRAYEKQVERLLASPHYGERWGRLWLDAARYADSDGFEKDKPRNVWFYRDWVVNALNRDLPYDQFIIEQLAGDLLPNATQDQLVATGFLRNSMINEEGGVDPEQFRMEAMFDRMDALGKAVLGFTVNCAQCHNHKYDPLKQEEYYRMFAFLNNSHEGALVVYTPEEQMKRANILAQTRELEAKLQELKPDWLAAMNAWEERVKNDQPEWQIVQPEVNDISTDGAKYLPQKDGSFLIGGYAPAKHRVKLMLKTNIKNITAFRLELLTDPNLPLNGPGRSYKGSCALTEFEVETAASEKDKPTKLKIARATADVNPPERELEAKFNDKSGKRRVSGPIEFAIDGKEETGWSIDVGPGLRNQPRKAVFNLAQPLANESSNEAGTTLNIYLSQRHGGWNNNDNEQQGIGRFRLSLTTAPEASADPLPAGVRQILSIPREQRTKAQVEAVFSFWRTTVSEWASYNQQIAALWQQHPEGTSQLVMNERAETRETFTLKRGDFLRPDKQIEPGVPAFLHPLPANAPKNRLTFAKWLVDRQSPTTARSLVNRLWQAYFGTGLYATAEDLGRQGERPSHPELLDWLAVELMEPSIADCGLQIADLKRSARARTVSTANCQLPTANWSLKHLHRLLVTSATYRQSSKVTPQLLEKDPDNRLLARGARFRVDGEIVRDIALAASGLLNLKLGGRSVYPPSPSFLYLPPVSYGTKAWKEEKGADRYRRSLYTFRFRSVPYPVLQAFDTPTGDVSCVRRTKSNTPLQALTTLNETLFLEAARALALKTLQAGGATDTQRLEFAFRRVLARKPTAQETVALLDLLNAQQARFASGALDPKGFALNEPAQAVTLPSGITLAQLAAWTAVSRALLNLDETITKG